MHDRNYFFVEDDPEGGYAARAIEESIFTQCETLEELRKMMQDAVQCHFEDEQRPISKKIKLHKKGKTVEPPPQ